MVFQEPKVEFIKMENANVIYTSGNQSTIGQCDGEINSTDDCVMPVMWNY